MNKQTSIKTPAKAGSSGGAQAIQRKKEKTEQKLSILKQSNVQLEQHNSLKDAFAVASCFGTRTVTYVFHHPIGITDLEERDWVCSRAEDIQYLLARVKDPNQGDIDKKINQIKDDFLAKEKLLIKIDDKYFYPDTIGAADVERRVYLHSVNDEMDKLIKAEKLAIINEHGADSDLLKKFKPSKSRDDLMPEGIRAHEVKIRSKLAEKATIAFLKGQNPQKFRTRGGVYDNQPQVKCKILEGIQDRARAFDQVNKTLQSTFTEISGNPLVPQTPVVPTPRSSKAGSAGAAGKASATAES